MNTIGRWGEDRFSIVFISFFLSFALLGLPSPTLAISLIFDGVCNRSLVVILPDWIPDMFSITERIGQISQFLIVPVVLLLLLQSTGRAQWEKLLLLRPLCPCPDGRIGGG